MKLNNFTIFIILLIIIFVLLLLFKWSSFKEETKESFVNFQSSNTTNSMIYIPQYSSDLNRTVVHVYDNIYFDQKNGTLIEVNSENNPPANDSTGSSIININLVPRSGISINTYPSHPLKSDGTVAPYTTSESLINEITSAYNEFSYRTQCATTDKYQIFYYAWNKDTYIHLVKNSGATQQANGTNIATYRFTSDGLSNTYTFGSNANNAPMPMFLNTNQTPPNITDINNDKMVSLPNYLNGLQVYQITPSVYYDITNGNIITKDSSTGLIVYSRDGPAINITPQNVGKINPTAGNVNAMTISDNNGGMVLVITYKSDTIISVLIPRSNDKSYIIGACARFNATKAVVDSSNDDENYPKTTTPQPAPSLPPNQNPNYDYGYGYGYGYPYDWQQMYSDIMMISQPMSSICGDDLSCKWYWYFKNMSGYNDNVSNTYSDDYVLKTEVVPPVCPRCPNCPETGICSSCGGNGGCGTVGAKTSESVSLNLTPVSGATTYKDSSGNIYLSQTDSSGNTKYVIQQSGTSNAAAGGVLSGKTYTIIDKNGQLVTTADPNQIGGGLALTALGAEKVATTVVDSTTGLAKDVLGTAGGVVDKAGNLVSAGGSGAVDLLKSTGSGAVDLLKSTGSGTVDFLKDVGSGIKSLGTGSLSYDGRINPNGQQNIGGVSSSRVGAGVLGYTPVSDQTYGRMSGQTPVDNYSYYGALQSKGGDFIPVTSDFSSFRK
jgi:hypothetical protein